MWINDGGHDAPLDRSSRRFLFRVVVVLLVVGLVILVLGLLGY